MQLRNEEVVVSIRCLAYNHEKYIRQCLDGFVMQKTNFRFEAIVHDDASTDKTADIIREYSEKYPEIIKPIFETENQYSKHDGTISRIMDNSCTGKYIAICEGDDYWIDPNKLQRQVDFLENNPEYSLCGTNALVCYENGTHYPMYFNNIFTSRELSPSEIIKNWILPTASIVYRREVKDGYPSWTNKIYSGDKTLVLISMTRGKIFFSKDISCIYRIDDVCKTSVSKNTSFIKMFTHHLALFQYFNDYTQKKYNKDIEVQITMCKYRIASYQKEEIFCNKRKRSLICALIWNPFYCISVWSKYAFNLMGKGNTKNVIALNQINEN